MNGNIKFILGVLVGILISGITVYAVNISSNNVEYDNTNSGLQSNNVEGAINELYQGVSAKLPINTFNSALYKETLTTRTTAPTDTTLDLSKGKYIVVLVNNTLFTPSASNNRVESQSIGLSCTSNNCIINLLSNRYFVKSGTSKYTTNNYIASNLWVSTYYIQINEETDVIHNYFYGSPSTMTTIPHIYSIQAIPINE